MAIRQIIAEKTKLEGEILGYKSKIKTLESEVSSLKEKVRNSDKKNVEFEIVVVVVVLVYSFSETFPETARIEPGSFGLADQGITLQTTEPPLELELQCNLC